MEEDKMLTRALTNNFTFSGIRTALLGASEYTVANIGVDITGSTLNFRTELRDCLVASVDALKKSPRADNLLLRVFLFSAELKGGIQELHGFKPLSEINTADYPEFNPDGYTNLYDAAYAAVGAANAYAAQLTKDDFPNNIINIIVTDGVDNRSTMTVGSVKKEIEKAIQGEITESVINILVGVNDTYCKAELEKFKNEGGFDRYISVKDASAQELAKLADFVSQSVSLQSQSLGTGGPSRSIAASI